ncbi:MAG: uracil-DNA glycosylase [Patescibacteria group bacterium]
MNKIEEMKKIRDEILVLKGSPLYEYRVMNNFLPVIGEGSHDAKMMFVGEAPGRNEAKTGRPFCGAAGKVLDQLLEHINVDRKSVYVTNIVKDRPPENRDPTVMEIEVYGPFLNRQIEIIKPRVIVALGRYAMGYIMKKFELDLALEPISKAHGKSYSTQIVWKDSSRKPIDLDIVVQYHPCVAVYNPNNLPNLKKDFEILKTY